MASARRRAVEVAIQLAVAAVWLLAIDDLMGRRLLQPGRHGAGQTALGWAFVVATGLIVVASVRLALARQRATAEHLAEANRSLALVDAVAQVVLAEDQPGRLLDELLEQLCAAAGFDAAAILLLDDSGELLRPGASRGFGPHDEALPVPVGKGLAGRAVAQRQSIVVDDMATVEGVDPRLRSQASLAVCPLVAFGEPIGALEVGRRARQPFTPAEVRALELAGSRAAAAITRVRLRQDETRSRLATDQARRHLSLLVRASAALAPVLDSIDTAGEPLAAAVVPEFADWFALHLVEDGRLRTVGQAHDDPDANERLARNGGSHPAAEQRLLAIVDDGRPELSFDLQKVADDGPAHHVLARDLGLESMIVAPVRVRGLSLGAVCVGTLPGRRGYRPADVEATGALATRIATALERVALHRETERAAREAARQADRLRRLMEAAVRIGAAGSGEAVAATLAASARQVSGARGVTVAVATEDGGERIVAAEGAMDGRTISLPLFDSARRQLGELTVALGSEAAEDVEPALVSLSQMSGAVLENRRLLDDLVTSRGRLQTLVDASPDAILELDGSGVITGYNRSAQEIFGPIADGEPLVEHLTPDGAATVAAAISRVAAGQTVPRLEVAGPRAGQRAFLTIALAPLRPRREGAGAVIALVSDITEQRRLEEQFLRAQRMEAIGRLAGGIAHDFNNLLTAVIGYGELALSQLPADHPVRSDLTEIVAAGRRAADLTSQLLTISRGQPAKRDVVDLADLISDMKRMFERVIGSDVALRTEVTSGAMRVRADRGQLEQVLLNLVLNARDAMPGGGDLTVRVGPAADRSGWAELAVSDTGIGMDEATSERCFDPFFTTKEQGKGTGLGLAAAYGIISQHGGRMGVRSELGQGTTFTVQLPVTDDTVSQADAPPAPPAGGTETVLLVEDQANVRELSRQVLERHGYRVLAAADGAKAAELAAAADHAPDLLVTDIVMPGPSGRELAAEMCARYPGLRVLYISGYAAGALDQPGPLGDGVPFLPKPFHPDELARRVREVLDSDG